jgi:hypothetical protein
LSCEITVTPHQCIERKKNALFFPYVNRFLVVVAAAAAAAAVEVVCDLCVYYV